MDCPYRIIVKQNGSEVGFEFNSFNEARDFANTCFETCDDSTEVIMIKKEG